MTSVSSDHPNLVRPFSLPPVPTLSEFLALSHFYSQVQGILVAVYDAVDFRSDDEVDQEGGYDYEMDGKLTEEFGLKDFRTWLREDSKF